MSSVLEAEAFIRKMLTDPVFGGRMEVRVLVRIAKGAGLTRRDLREARKHLGIITEKNENGSQIWRWPPDVGKRH